MKAKLEGVVITVLLCTTLLSGCKGSKGAAGLPGLAGNNSPVANAGPDQKVSTVEIPVTLDGSGSKDPDGHALTYAWSFTARPVGSLATFSDSTLQNPSFTPDKAGKYELSLVVADGKASSQPASVTIRAGMPVPDTGQARLYGTVIGEDGDYAINPMSFIDNGDGTITDDVTGLTWQKCTNGQSGADCATGTASTYNWYEATGTYDATSNSSTTNVCGSLDLAGTGWRLPTDFELVTIVDYGRILPSINSTYFPNTQPAYYWSSSGYAGDTAQAWGVGFDWGGRWPHDLKTNSRYVRCVR